MYETADLNRSSGLVKFQSKSPCFQFERRQNFPFDWPASVSNILTVRRWAEPKIVGRNFTSRILYVKDEFLVYPLLTRCQRHVSQVGLLQTAHYWANAGVLLGARVCRRVAFETIKLIDANVLCTIFDINYHQNIAHINMQGASV